MPVYRCPLADLAATVADAVRRGEHVVTVVDRHGELVVVTTPPPTTVETR